MLCDRWRGCKKYREYIEPWVKYRKSNRKFKICIVPSLMLMSGEVKLCMDVTPTSMTTSITVTLENYCINNNNTLYFDTKNLKYKLCSVMLTTLNVLLCVFVSPTCRKHEMRPLVTTLSDLPRPLLTMHLGWLSRDCCTDV